MIGMLERGEADMTVCGITADEEQMKVVNFSYPLYASDISFMTNKPEPYAKHFAIFDSFSLWVWIGVVTCLILIPLILYMFLKGRKSYSTVMMAVIASLLEKSFPFEARRKNTVFLLLTWFLGTTVLTTSYKAVILSVITFPKMVVIRDISDLSKAAKENSVTCISYKEGIPCVSWYESEDDRLESIGDCLKRSDVKSLHGQGPFDDYPYKKVFISDRVDLITYARRYFISDDSFAVNQLGMAYSKNFCCPRKLESVIHRIVAADLYPKTLRDRDYVAQLRMNLPKDAPLISPLSLKDLSGAFIVLFIGYLLSLLIFIAEIITKKLSRSRPDLESEMS